jgi:adenosylcobyric acid synthase
MIMGCTSDAGKSFLVTALCRHFSNQGISVAPFKAQNMSNNAAVTADGLEMGRAQYVQALAARAIPQARMNPVLLKPSADTYSQVIVLGRFDPAISTLPWHERKARLWPVVRDSLRSLRADYDQLVIEGAGSPAEINLRDGDIVNMTVAKECRADVYVASDIDRGGSFAHLLGTWMCLEPDEQARVKGFILNRFRGDPALLGNAMDWLRERTGVPTVAVVPLIPHTLPEEDTLHHRAEPAVGNVAIALIAYPYASNLDEFDPLIYERGVSVVPIRESDGLDRFDALLLPGSKNTAASLRFLRESGLAAELVRVAGKGVSILGVCGGMQILGRSIRDPHGLEGGDAECLGLLDITTTLDIDKTTRQRATKWGQGEIVEGYEIHHGRTEAGSAARPFLEDGLGWEQDNVRGVYLHGLFENTGYRVRFLQSLGWQGRTEDWRTRLDSQMDGVAAVVAASGLGAAFTG